MKKLSSIVMLLLGSAAWGQDAPMMAKEHSGVAIEDWVDEGMCAPEGIAVGGYDLVSYREPAGPIPGSEAFSATYEGETYLFAASANRDRFLADPERYLPAYSGFCAITLALGRVTCPDYTNFKIEGGRLLLFETTGFTNGRVVWDTDPPAFRKQADDNFDELTKTP